MPNFASWLSCTSLCTTCSTRSSGWRARTSRTIGFWSLPMDGSCKKIWNRFRRCPLISNKKAVDKVPCEQPEEVVRAGARCNYGMFDIHGCWTFTSTMGMGHIHPHWPLPLGSFLCQDIEGRPLFCTCFKNRNNKGPVLFLIVIGQTCCTLHVSWY